MNDEAHLPDDPNENDLSAEVIDELSLDTERLDEHSAATLDSLSSKIDAIEASAELLDEVSDSNPEEIIDDKPEAQTNVDTDVEVLVKKPAAPAPKAARKPEWKQQLEQMRAEEAAQKRALLAERQAYEASIRAEKEAEEAARREEMSKAQANYKAEWQSKQAEREAAKTAMIERVRQEREQKERERAALMRGELTYPKPEAKAPYPTPSAKAEENAKELAPKPSADVKETTTKPSAGKSKKAPKEKAAPKKAEAKKTGDELDNRINRLSKPED